MPGEIYFLSPHQSLAVLSGQLFCLQAVAPGLQTLFSLRRRLLSPKRFSATGVQLVKNFRQATHVAVSTEYFVSLVLIVATARRKYNACRADDIGTCEGTPRSSCKGACSHGKYRCSPSTVSSFAACYSLFRKVACCSGYTGGECYETIRIVRIVHEYCWSLLAPSSARRAWVGSDCRDGERGHRVVAPFWTSHRWVRSCKGIFDACEDKSRCRRSSSMRSRCTSCIRRTLYFLISSVEHHYVRYDSERNSFYDDPSNRKKESHCIASGCVGAIPCKPIKGEKFRGYEGGLGPFFGLEFAIRPLLFAYMTSGHTFLKIAAGFVWTMTFEITYF